MKTNQIAKLANVHPNTVHLYEKWGYISPVPRQAKYTLVHALQMKVARLAFRQDCSSCICVIISLLATFELSITNRSSLVFKWRVCRHFSLKVGNLII